MRIDIVTLFPDMFSGPFAESIIKRAIDRQLVNIAIHNLRDYTADKHHVVDDYPYGGGPGMVLKPEPLFAAVEAIKGEEEVPVILLTPQGRLLRQEVVDELASYERMVLICGHYEGVDERVREHLVSDEISIGDYVLSGGEPAAIVLVDAVVRQLPGALGSEASASGGSHVTGLLQHPQYTHPQVYRGWEVPIVLLSGNHAQIAKWRRERSIMRTLRQRPDLLEKAELTPEEKRRIREQPVKLR
ncbi:MAG: tRNA (guanosine(37)-N1)-methyltransferase TrmD [Dehalococcoidia bacterium]|jgi:tRNA (guanine37-N1)-methyltransferase|nr:tRNA (guanosine(37)-N1)-methyltransferase TrmD [Chloroflexota bacterium]MCK4242839.1 tRNA (guanosine(37)-N1)-methyltransferase TrmD [Dehalococcoidia bacterium]